MREVFVYQEAIHRGRSAKRGDAIFLYLSQHIVGAELLMVIYKHGGTGKPLSVELAPHGFAPSCICHGEVYAVFAQVVPIHSCGQVSQCIEIVVRHHLGFAAGATGKIHQHGVAVVVDMGWSHKGGCLVPLLVPVVKCLVVAVAHRHQHLYAGTFGHGSLYL